MLDSKEIARYDFNFIIHSVNSICTDKSGNADRTDDGENCKVYKERKENEN